ncbi:phosphoheptose isomerase [bacterium BMS3Bbin06]|nr:phosphoheptose isomerase [bacterium BMS3Abin08]GBE33866.1 phosphoheptose isomerase [bacterium BMS3Bbin06]HDO35079.1 SIS domain-containing protein [Nitrospirota bacterium]HDY71760.1 SIS domain-containing protein [Nitrospirota bacterium]
MKETIKRAVEESLSVKKRFFEENTEAVMEVSKVIADAFNDGKKLLLFGNGGSASDASHIAAEFVNRFKRERPGLPAIALNTDMAVITSIANDYDYSEIFARQLRSLSEGGDIVLAISTSGLSKNILKALDAAKKRGLIRISLTGEKGRKMASKSDYAFVVPSADTPRIQEVHIMIGHIICEVVEEILFELPRSQGQPSGE